MSRLQRIDNKKDAKLLTAEFTTGQLVVVICVSLFVAMACFGLGILVARVDPAFESSETAPAPDPDAVAPETVTYEMPAFAQAPVEPSPRPQNTEAQRTPESPPPRSPFMDNEPRLTTLPPLSPQRQGTAPIAAPSRPPRTAPADEPDAAAGPETPETEAPAAEPHAQTSEVASAAPATPEAPSPEAQVPQLTPIEPVEEPVMLTPVSPQTELHRDRGSFGIQLAAFSGSDRRARAESLQRRIGEQLNLDAEIIPSDDDMFHRVVVVGFSDREAANVACSELRSKPGLSEAFVRPL